MNHKLYREIKSVIREHAKNTPFALYDVWTRFERIWRMKGIKLTEVSTAMYYMRKEGVLQMLEEKDSEGNRLIGLGPDVEGFWPDNYEH